MIQLFESHTGRYIKERILDILKEFEIEMENVFSITSDNGRNMVKAIELFNDEATDQSIFDDRNTDDVMKELDSINFSTVHLVRSICYWYAEFKRGRTDTDDIPSTGRPNDAVIPENVEKTLKIIMSDRKVKVREIADILKISAGSVHTIIHEHLGIKKVFSKWVPRLLTPEQKQQRIDESKSCLDMFTRNKSEFLRRYITMDETWIHHFTQSQIGSLLSGMQPVKAAQSDQRRSSWLARRGRQTINSDYYMALLERLKDEIAKKRPHMAKKKVLFHQDNAPCHKSMKTMAKLNELGFELLPHPPYSPDLAPSDYWLFD
ncbi:hypothetical protein ACLKA6_008633 [Drosophila palustris]